MVAVAVWLFGVDECSFFFRITSGKVAVLRIPLRYKHNPTMLSSYHIPYHALQTAKNHRRHLTMRI
jgi:hypothetical protein